MKILFDSNCLIADFYMESTPFRVLRTQLPNSGVQLLVSEVVLVEVQNKYRERTQEIVRRIDKDLALLRRLTKRTHVDSRYGDIVESAGRRYDQFLMEELQSLGASFLSIPPVSHQDLIVRTISRRKPFKQNGDGYRDALIWYSVLQALRESHDEIVFITANRADFYQGESLHPDLCADLEVAKVPRERFRICESVTQFNESVLTLLHSQHVTSTCEDNANDAISALVEDRLVDQLDELLEFLPLDPSHFGLPSDAGDVDFVTALGVENAHLHKIVPLESGEKLVAASIIVYCQLELSVNWKSRWAAFEFGDSTRDVQDLERSLGVNVELTVNSANTEISSIYIRGVELPLLRDVVEDRSELFSR